MPPFPESNWDVGKLPSPEHALAAFAAYDAYFGTYTDTDRPRPFKLEGDRLEISDGKTYRRVLERVH